MNSQYHDGSRDGMRVQSWGGASAGFSASGGGGGGYVPAGSSMSLGGAGPMMGGAGQEGGRMGPLVESGAGSQNAPNWSNFSDANSNIFSLDPNSLQLKHLLNNEGGLGEVWVGELREPSGVHQVAVKKYPSAFAQEEVEMFRRETGVLFMAATRCHNVCKVYGTTIKDDKMCIVMKLYRESMLGLMRRYPGGKLPLTEIRRYGREICKAVAELHEQSIISQDLKPPNFLIDDYDHCVVADFGISKIVQGTIGVHMPSNVQGTFNYMSPEAFDPEQFGGVTTQADSWSFACSLLEMITGVKPWSGIKMAPIVRKVMNRETPEIPPGLPPPVDHMLKSCFSFMPHQRPTFPQMFRVFRLKWTPQPSSGPSDSLSNDILRPISGLFDMFKSGSDAQQGAIGPGGGQKMVGGRPVSVGGNAASWGGAGSAMYSPGGGEGKVGPMASAEHIAEAEKTVSMLYHKASDAVRLEEEAKAAQAEVASLRAQLASSQAIQHKIRLESDRQVAAALQGVEEQRVMEHFSVSEEWERERASLRGRVAELQREKSGLEVEVEELRSTLKDRAILEQQRREAADRLTLSVTQLQAEKATLLREREEQRKGGGQRAEREQQLEDRLRKADAQVSEMEQSYAKLVNEKRTWDQERRAVRAEHEAEKQALQGAFERQRTELEKKVQDIEAAFDRAIELEIQRRTPDSMRRLSNISRDSVKSAGSNDSLDVENTPFPEDGIEMDDDTLKRLTQPKKGESGSSNDEAEEFCQLAAQAHMEGRKTEAEALCQLAYESARHRGESALDAYRRTPPQLREYFKSFSLPDGSKPNANLESSASPPQPVAAAPPRPAAGSDLAQHKPVPSSSSREGAPSASLQASHSSHAPAPAPPVRFSSLSYSQQGTASMASAASSSASSAADSGLARVQARPASKAAAGPQARGSGLGLFLDGTRITQVLHGTPSHKAGLREGDDIKRVNGAPANVATCGPMLRESFGDDKLTVTVLRNEMLHEVKVVLAQGRQDLGAVEKRHSGREIAL